MGCARPALAWKWGAVASRCFGLQSLVTGAGDAAVGVAGRGAVGAWVAWGFAGRRRTRRRPEAMSYTGGARDCRQVRARRPGGRVGGGLGGCSVGGVCTWGVGCASWSGASWCSWRVGDGTDVPLAGACCGDFQGEVESASQVLQRDVVGEFQQLLIGEVPAQGVRQVGGDDHRCAAHRGGVVEDEPIEVGEAVARALFGQPGDLLVAESPCARDFRAHIHAIVRGVDPSSGGLGGPMVVANRYVTMVW